ncbi:MAG: hypothetical protein HY000_27380 [Planctomycetes bacterium]|nr:hypothetical protein [Planctomycetota bacterium]
MRQALGRLDNWLGAGSNGSLWRSYLKTGVLRSQLAGPSADPSVVAEVLGKFSSPAPGLDRQQFVDVRSALETWIAELRPLRPEDLPPAIAEARGRFLASNPSDVSRTQRTAQAALARLDRFLSTGGERGIAWKKFLRWNELQAGLVGGSLDYRLLDDIRGRLHGGHLGLELRPFADLAAAIQLYAETSRRAGGQSARSTFESAVQTIEQRLGQAAPLWTDEQAEAVGAALGQIESLGQTPDLVHAIRGHYSHPNLLFQIADELLAVGIARPVRDVAPVREVILGTDIRGTGHTFGDLNVRLASSVDRAVIETVFTGTTLSKTVGVNGPATIYADGTTRFFATKRLFLDAEGLSTVPAVATAQTRSRIRGVAVRGGRLIQKIADRRVQQNKPASERIGSQRAQRRLSRRLDDEAGSRLAESNRDFVNRFRAPLVRRGQFPEVFQFSTTSDFLRLTALNASRSQLGSPTPPPALDGKHALAVRLHESTVNNLAAINLAGQTFTGDRLREMAIDLLGEVPEPFEDEDPRPWSITFAQQRPITLDVDDQRATLVIRGSEYTSNEEPYSALNITVHYTFEPTGKGLRAVRQGDIEIRPPGSRPGQRLPNRLIAIRRVIQRKLERVFKPEIVREGLVLPGAWEKAGTLPLTRFAADDGWFVLAWRQPEHPASR